MAHSSDQGSDSRYETGGLIPGTRIPAFRLTTRAGCPIPVLIAVPHAGRKYPESIEQRMRDPAYSRIRLEDRFADKIGEQLARLTGAALLVADAPRAMIDLNRASDDVDWDMVADAGPGDTLHSAANRRARSGLGLVPRRLPGLGEIWNRRMALSELNARIRHVHAPYHGALSRTLGDIADRWGAALLLDLHSMPPLRRKHRQEKPVHFVLGDRFGASAHDTIIASAIRHLADVGGSVAHNRPYAGGYVLDRHAAMVRGHHAIQLEICRTRYLDADLSETTPEIDGLVAMLADLVRLLGEETARLGRMNTTPLAAE